MTYTFEELEKQARDAAAGGFRIPNKYYPEIKAWENEHINEFMLSSYPAGAKPDGELQRVRDLKAMQQDEIRNYPTKRWEAKLKQDEFNKANHKEYIIPEHIPTIHKRSWLTKNHGKVEYNSMAAH